MKVQDTQSQMRRTTLKRKTQLKRKTPLRRISTKRVLQIKEELAIRIALCKRAGGTWVYDGSLIGGYCKGGLCEYCGGKPSPPDFRLHPHEEVFRSSGGKLSLDNSKMACHYCHLARHGIQIGDIDAQNR